jgi:hypothetical protein
MNESSVKNDLERARSLVNGIERILARINKTRVPAWLLEELNDASQKAQCIQYDAERAARFLDV